MINQVVIVGRMTKQAELRYTGSGIAVATLTVAIERPYSNANGERETDFVNVVAWRKTAEIISNFTAKGSLVGITGRIQTRNYTNNEGRKIYITEILCENFQMLEPKAVTENRKKDNNQQTNNNQQPSQNYNSGLAQNNKSFYDDPNSDGDPFIKGENGEYIDIDDSSLPF